MQVERTPRKAAVHSNRVSLIAACCAILCVACVEHSVRRCPSGSEPLRRTELFFGLARKDGSVIEERAFAAFFDAVVAPALPTGFALLETDGQYLGKDGQVVREPGRVLVVVHRGDPDAERALELVRARYRQAFEQESVLRVDTSSCASF